MGTQLNVHWQPPSSTGGNHIQPQFSKDSLWKSWRTRPVGWQPSVPAVPALAEKSWRGPLRLAARFCRRPDRRAACRARTIIMSSPLRSRFANQLHDNFDQRAVAPGRWWRRAQQRSPKPVQINFDNFHWRILGSDDVQRSPAGDAGRQVTGGCRMFSEAAGRSRNGRRRARRPPLSRRRDA